MSGVYVDWLLAGFSKNKKCGYKWWNLHNNVIFIWIKIEVIGRNVSKKKNRI